MRVALAVALATTLAALPAVAVPVSTVPVSDMVALLPIFDPKCGSDAGLSEYVRGIDNPGTPFIVPSGKSLIVTDVQFIISDPSKPNDVRSFTIYGLVDPTVSNGRLANILLTVSGLLAASGKGGGSSSSPTGGVVGSNDLLCVTGITSAATALAPPVPTLVVHGYLTN